jgi:hypothetical protein
MSDSRDISFDIVAELAKRRREITCMGVYECDKHSSIVITPMTSMVESIITKRNRISE